jgi:hypothetical protein
MDTRLKWPGALRPEREAGAEEDFASVQARRHVLGMAAATPLFLLGLVSSAKAADASACFNLDDLPASQQSLRRSLNFKPQSPDPKKHCSICSFFTATEGGCGKCALLSGGPVGDGSVCDSWTARS